jgi:hypothetical protein
VAAGGGGGAKFSPRLIAPPFVQFLTEHSLSSIAFHCLLLPSEDDIGHFMTKKQTMHKSFSSMTRKKRLFPISIYCMQT